MLDNLKIMLGIAAEDTEQDVKLSMILEHTRSRLKTLLGGIEPPSELDYIVLDVSIIRFNRIGSEGLSSHSVEGENLAFAANDFDGYSNEIQAFLGAQKDNSRGKVRFL